MVALLWFHDCKRRDAGPVLCSPRLLLKENKISEFLKTDCESSKICSNTYTSTVYVIKFGQCTNVNCILPRRVQYLCRKVKDTWWFAENFRSIGPETARLEKIWVTRQGCSFHTVAVLVKGKPNIPLIIRLWTAQILASNTINYYAEPSTLDRPFFRGIMSSVEKFLTLYTWPVKFPTNRLV